MSREPWRVSLHGGHSGEFCEHAEGDLRQVLEAAVRAGYRTFGVTEHAPRSESRFLYAEEIEKGYDVTRLAADFESYAATVFRLADELAEDLQVLRAFEIEVVPGGGYVEEMKALRQRHGFDYMVGSVHYVDEISIDGAPSDFERAVRDHGGLEALAIRYYEEVTAMIEALRPEVVGHLDLIRLLAGESAALDTPSIRSGAHRTLEAALSCSAIIDVNTAAYRKGLASPYPAPWLVQEAASMGLGFCFGDDSHGPDQVGTGIDRARDYLLTNDVTTIAVLTREGNDLVRQEVTL